MLAWKKLLGVATILVLSFVVLFPQQLIAQQEHLVTGQDLQKAIVSQETTRAENLAKIQNLLSDRSVERAVANAGTDPAKVREAVSTLSDEELATLVSKTQAAQNDFAAGAISHRDLTLIIGAIIIIVVIIAIAA
jgi:hypothetical protein